MKGIAKANLPFEIRLLIMKEYLRAWSTRIPTNSRAPTSTFPETNRACLNYFWPTWTAFPIVDGYEVKSRFLRQSQEMQLSEIMSLWYCSKEFSAPLELFFAANMTWHFCCRFTFEDFFCPYDPDEPAPWPRHKNFRKICLQSEKTPSVPRRESSQFVRLLDKMLQSISSSIHAFRSLEILELMIDAEATSRLLAFIKVKSKTPEMRIRRVVTLVQDIQKQKPSLKICLRVSVCDFQWILHKTFDPGESNKSELTEFKEVDAEKVDAEKVNAEVADFESNTNETAPGFSKREVSEFLNGTSPLLEGLQSVEFAHIGGNYCSRRELRLLTFDSLDINSVYFQMTFAREWRAIRENGSKVVEV